MSKMNDFSGLQTGPMHMDGVFGSFGLQRLDNHFGYQGRAYKCDRKEHWLSKEKDKKSLTWKAPFCRDWNF